MTFGQIARQVRQDHGRTMKDAAAFGGISPQYICDVEHGKPPGRGFLDAFADTYGLDTCAVYALAGRLPADLVPVTLEQAERFAELVANRRPGRRSGRAA